MAIRMSGLSSGMDTEAIVGALMSAQSMKKTKVEQAKTKLEWKQTKWKDLNEKLKKLYYDQVSKMQLQASYMTKKATVSDSTKASVTANTKAANGNYSMEIKNIATSQYLTGAKIGADSTSKKLIDIDGTLLNKELLITNGDKSTKFAITSSTTIADFTSALKNAGLNANYDTNQQRFFISSKDSGLKNAFSITTSEITAEEVAGREAVRNASGYVNMSEANKRIVDEAIMALQTSGVGTDAYNQALESISKAAFDTKTAAANTAATTYVKAKLYGENYDSYKAKAEESLKSKYFNSDGTLKEGKTQEAYEEAVIKQADKDTSSFVDQQVSSNKDVKLEIETAAYAGKTVAEIDALDEVGKNKYYAKGDGGSFIINEFEGTSLFSQESIRNSISPATSNYAGIADRNNSISGSALGGLGLADVVVTADGKVSVNGGENDSTNSSIPSGMALVAASDSKIILNGAELTSSSATVSANGLSISLTGLTKEDEPITFSVTNDVDGVYDSVKTFLTEYNSVMKEMFTLYNASSAKGYDPLTSEQKKEMSDDDIEMWENKIKDSLLRRDSTLEGIMQSMRSVMMTQVEYDGKKYSLASFGIMTSTNYSEGGQYHIYGDKDDSTYADRDDKLRKALEEDPDTVVNVLSSIFTKLRETMSQKMSGTTYSSSMTFYNDKKMNDEMKSYEKQITEWEDRLATMEDAYYKKFTAMETALAKLQAQQSSLGGLFGG